MIYVKHSTHEAKRKSRNKVLVLGLGLVLNLKPSKSNSRVKKCQSGINHYNCTFRFQSATSYHIFF